MSKESLLTITQLKKSLKDLSPADLISLITGVAQACPQAKEFLSIKFGDKKVINEIFENYKEKVEYEFFPPNGFGRLNLREAKKAITDFKKMCSDKIMLIDLMLFYVENCVEFTNSYGDINESFYNSATGMYANVVKEINSKDMAVYKKFDNRLKSAAEYACEGWGFKDEMMDIYYDIAWLEPRQEKKY